ncbi:MAG: hypothetical protein LBV40_02515 [Methanomicrobiales archaeon]|jgi:hypothetical protein|nr:hypothetical protein [Methanomicrobiales archaeon]
MPTAFIEKDFDEMKNDLDMRRLRVQSDARMKARLFIQFIAEIYMRQPPKTGNSIILIVRLTAFTQKCGRILLFMRSICGIIAVFGGCHI